jgi:antitoxin MazE
MLVQLAKWGNSLAVRIPAAYAKEIGASENSKAELSVENGRLVLTLLSDIPYFELSDLIAQITEENRHEEIGTGPAVGEEFG